MACKESAGGEGKESQWSFLCIYSCFPITCVTSWALLPVRLVEALDYHWVIGPTVNCACRDLGHVLLMRIILKPSSFSMPLSMEKLSSGNQSLVPKGLGTVALHLSAAYFCLFLGMGHSPCKFKCQIHKFWIKKARLYLFHFVFPWLISSKTC